MFHLWSCLIIVSVDIIIIITTGNYLRSIIIMKWAMKLGKSSFHDTKYCIGSN